MAKRRPIKNKDVIIDGLIMRIDFYRIQKVMTVLEWTWGENENSPSLSELQERAESLLEMVLSGKCSEASTGGFFAWRNSDEDFGIRFVLEESSSSSE